jgi:hypothetical protein
MDRLSNSSVSRVGRIGGRLARQAVVFVACLADACNRCRRWRRIGIAHGRTATLGATRVYGKDSDYSFRAQARYITRAGVQDVSACRRHIQRHGNDPGLPVACFPQSSESFDIVLLERAPVTLWGVCWQCKGELIGTLCEAWEPGRIECSKLLRLFMSGGFWVIDIHMDIGSLQSSSILTRAAHVPISSTLISVCRKTRAKKR